MCIDIHDNTKYKNRRLRRRRQQHGIHKFQAAGIRKMCFNERIEYYDE